MDNKNQIELMCRDAKGNAYAYRILIEKFETARIAMQSGKVINIKDIELSFPLIMTLTFACELYIKILILKSGLTYDREHDLYSLYNILTPDVQSKILNHYKTLNQDDSDFIAKLENNKEVFKEWRYYYEIDLSKQSSGFYVVDTPFLDMLLTSLEKTYLEV